MTLKNMIELADKYKTDVLLGRYIKCKETGEFLSESRMVSTVEVHLVTTGGEFYNGYSLNDATIIVACLKLCRRTFLQRNQILFVKGLYHEDVVFSFFTHTTMQTFLYDTVYLKVRVSSDR